MTVRPALSGRLLVSFLALLPIVDIAREPDLIAADLLIAVIVGFFALMLWRLHIYADGDVVAFRGGRLARVIRRDQIAAMAFSSPLPMQLAFLGADDRVLLEVPIAMTLPPKEVARLSQFLQVPLRS